MADFSQDMKIIKTQVLIIGGGAAGLNAALNLKTEDVLLIEKHGSNSLFSPWNLMVKPNEELRKKILEVGYEMNRKDLLRVFLDDYKKVIRDLKKIGVKFRKSNIGLVPNYPAPGLEVKKIFLKRLKKKKVKILKGKVENFLIDENENVKGVEAFISNSQPVRIFFNYLILAAGGIGGFFKFQTGSQDSDGSILSLCYEAGFKMTNLEFFMFHPFLIIDKRLPKALVSGDILTKMEYEDEKGVKFLSKEVADALKNNEYHYIFEQMTKEFYLQSLNGRIFGRLICSDEWFRKYKKENEFGIIFKNHQKNDLKKIELHPAFHFLVGGLTINKNGRTSQKNVYAAGEITGGLHGSNRIGGLAVLEALVFGKRAALDINKGIENKKMTIPEKIRKIGRIGSLDGIRENVWKSLGPVKKKEDLKKLKNLLDCEKSATSQKKLLKKIIEICLLRKESIGTFLRDDLPIAKRANSSFLIKKIIIKENAK